MKTLKQLGIVNAGIGHEEAFRAFVAKNVKLEYHDDDYTMIARAGDLFQGLRPIGDGLWRI
jgi:hypothetical protein